jgi:hypothetical protein
LVDHAKTASPNHGNRGWVRGQWVGDSSWIVFEEGVGVRGSWPSSRDQSVVVVGIETIN